MSVWQRLLLLLCLVAATAMPGRLRAQEEIGRADRSLADEKYIEAARDALGDSKNMPWYDAEKDDVRAIDVPIEDQGQFENRKSRWNSTPRKGATGSGVNMPRFSFGAALTNIFYWIAVAGAFALVAFLFYLLVRAYLLGEEAAAASSTRAAVSAAEEDDVQRIESLPFTVARPRGDLLDEALAQYQGGNFRQAVIYLYSYLLIQLDRHQQIHLARGKTNRMYLRELRQQPRLRSILEQTMTAFEDVFFGNHNLSREEFEACWGQLDDFHKHVEQVAT